MSPFNSKIYRPQLEKMSTNLPTVLLFFIAIITITNIHGIDAADIVFPPSCNRIECPTYDVIDNGNGFQIRRYNSTAWMSTLPIQDISFLDATRTGFLQLFNYISGKNDYKQKIEMTAPVLTQVSPSDGPFCSSAFTVSFYIPKKNQENPPPAKNLHVQKWGVKYAAVSQFGGFVTDDGVGQEAAKLYSNLKGSSWAKAVDKGVRGDPRSVYTVAGYNSPFEFTGRINEIWMIFELEGSSNDM